MLSHKEANAAWEAALRAHASTPMQGEKGAYMPIGAKSMALLDPLWKGRSGQALPDVGRMLAEGKDVRVFGDPHFGHANIIKMCSRPFDGVEQMDLALWGAVEAAHREADFVLCVGDWSMKDAIGWARKVAAQFPGKHATTVGNHDAKGAKPAQWLEAGGYASLAFSVERDMAKAWALEEDAEMAELLDWDGVPRRIMVGVSHWPLPPDRMPGPSWVNLHGHIHNRPDRPLRANCSVEAIGFAPRSIQSMIGVRLLDDLVRRQSGLAGVMELEGRDEGDSSYL